MHWGIPPSLVIESTCAVKMLKELCVSFAAPEIQITDFEVAPEMASVVSLSAVIGEELECVIFRNVFGVCLHELFDSVPKSLDGLAILRQRNSESIDLLVILHEQERVIMQVTEELDVGLDSPIVVVFLKEVVPEEESGVEPAHVSVWDRAPIDNLLLLHLLTTRFCSIFVDPFRLVPVIMWDQTVFSFGRHDLRCIFDEIRAERLFVEEDIRIPVSLVKPVFVLLDALKDTLEIPVTSQNDESGIGLPLVCRVSMDVVVVVLVRYIIRVVGTEFGGDTAERRCFSVLLMRDAEDEVQSNERTQR